jgi:hypothetical protein
MTSTNSLSLKNKKVDKIMEEYKDILFAPTGVPTHFQVKHPIDITLNASLPNGPIYRCSLMENDEIKCHASKGAHMTQILPLQKPTCDGSKERWDLVALH